MSKSLETQNLPTLNQEEIEILNRPRKSKKTKKKLNSNLKKPNTENPRTIGFTGEFYQTLKELMPILLKHFQTTEEKGILPNSFYKASLSQILKPEYKDSARKENYRSISPMNTTPFHDKNPQLTVYRKSTSQNKKGHIKQTHS